MHHVFSNTGRTATLAVIALSSLIACGGKGEKSSGDDTAASTGGNAGSGGSISSGGTSTSGPASGTDATASGGAASVTTTAGGAGAGGSATSDTSGTTETTGVGGNAGQGTVSTTGGGTGGTGTTGPTGAVATLGDPCDSPGALACAGNYQKLTLVCGGDGEWEVNQTCASGEFCDTVEGANQGTCAPSDPDCLEREPGERFCVGDDVHECGPDTITTDLVAECDGRCDEGECADEGCPTGANDVICSDDCGGPAEACTLASTGCPYLQFLSADLPLTLRLPSAAQSSACSLCDGTPSQLLASVRGLIAQGELMRLSVREPWGLRVRTIDTLDVCAEPLESCMILPAQPETTFIMAFASDPAAGPVDMQIELVEEGALCP